MRTLLAIFFVGLVVGTLQPAYAGSLSLKDGQPTWTPTKCMEPVEPPSLVAMSPDSQADNMNDVMTQYNQYSQVMTDYMNCLSGEAQNDATATSAAITSSAQVQIDAAHKKVSDLNSILKSKQPNN